MKTKKEILHELVHEQQEELTSDPRHYEGYAEERKKALDNGDLTALVAYNLAGAIASETSKIQDLMRSEPERKQALFKTIYIAILLIKKAEEAYEKQFKVGEE